jgi:hypothetical protein
MANHKKQLLLMINTIPVEDVMHLLQEGTFTLQEVRDAGYSAANLAQLERLQEQMYRDLAAREEKDKEQVRQAAKARNMLQDVAAGRVDIEQLQQHLLEGTLSEVDLLALPGMTTDLVRAVWEFERRVTDFAAWDKLPPLKQGATDVFFFGLPGSGKTCILASLFRYMHRKGLIVDENANPAGTRYRDQLRQEFSLGILPQATQTSTEKGYILNYMPIGLRNQVHGGVHPLNMIDMAGSFINSTYSLQDGPGTIWERGYLTGPNRKLLFFVIDYAQHAQALRSKDGDQSSKLEAVLTLLDKKGILERTDGLYLLVSKADQFPNGTEPGSHAREFLTGEYLNFIQSCRDLKAKYRDQFRITGYPYTVGEVRFGQLITSYNERSPEFVVDRILHHAFRNRTGKLEKLGLNKRA